MKIEKNFTTGILSGMCGVLLLFVLTGTTTREAINVTPMYEFYDLEDTRGLIFNKFTGEIKYETIREAPQIDEFYLNLTNWNGQRDGARVKYFD